MEEGEREREEEGGDVTAAAATVSPVSPLLLACQAGGNTEQGRSRGGDGGRGWSVLNFILVVLLSHVRRRQPHAHTEREWIQALDTEPQIYGLPAVSTGDW